MNGKLYKDYVLTARVMQDEKPVNLTINLGSAWILVTGIQLATRHPDINEPMKAMLTAVARQFQDVIIEVHPEVEDLLERGWDATYDVGRQ